MLEPTLPPDEERRLQVLLDLQLLDTGPDECFERITRLASRLFEVPIASVGLVDAQRVWFKSHLGVAEQEIPRRTSFCAHAILQDGVFVIEDAGADWRFADNPYVTGPHNLRFYAAQPVAAPDGSVVGTLCLLDHAPRRFSEAECALLRDLGAVVANEFASRELRLALRRQRDSETWLRALLDHLPESVLMLDDAAKVLSANPAAERMFGAPADQLVGRSLQSLLVEAVPDLVRCLPEGQVCTREGTGRRLDGHTFPLEISTSVMHLGGYRRYAAIARDNAAQLENARRIRAAGERRGTFFKMASHELRTPLASILGFSDLLLKRDFDAATARELLDIVHRQATHLSALVTQVLELARLEAGGPAALQLGPQRIETIVAQALKSVEHRGQNGRIALDLGVGLPPVAADAHKLCAALVHVLDNSIVYSAPDSPITVRAWRGPDAAVGTVLLRVSDTGIGMSAEQQASMFEAFWRAQPGAKPDSTGLGLAIFRETIALHNGSIEVGSTLGRSTDITITLPAAAELPHA
jgi:PAS domain S-box-containing protein